MVAVERCQVLAKEINTSIIIIKMKSVSDVE